MRSSRVAGKPQLIRSDMLLPVKSQNTTLFAVTWVDVVADDDNDDNAKRTHSSSTTRIEFGPLDVLSREHGFLYYATHTSWTTQSGITTLLRLSFAFGNSYIRTCRCRARTHCLTNKVTRTHRRIHATPKRVGHCHCIEHNTRGYRNAHTHMRATNTNKQKLIGNPPNENEHKSTREHCASTQNENTLCSIMRFPMCQHTLSMHTHTRDEQWKLPAEDAQRAREKYGYLVAGE